MITSNIKKEKRNVSNLALGMFVTELDIPWLESPFLLQGFVLENLEQITTLQSICKIVWVDRSRSIGNEFVAPTKLKIGFTREGAVIRLRDNSQSNTVTNKQAHTDTTQISSGVSFFDIIRELKNNPNPQLLNNSSSTSTSTFHQEHSGKDLADEVSSKDEKSTHTSNVSITQHLKNDVLGLLSGLFSWTSKKDQSNSSIPFENTTNKPLITSSEEHRVTIFEEQPTVEEEIASIYPIFEKSQLATREIFKAIANEQNLDLTHVSEIIDSMVDSIERTPDALMWLAKLKQTDDYAFNHALNVSINLMAFASFLSLPKKQIKELGLAGLLQDIGKVKISSKVLLKPGKLSPAEFEVAKKHVDEGLSILEKTSNIPSSVIFLVAQHHERIDGSGYPYKLSGKQLGLESQIAGLIDTYCAMTSNRPYAKASPNQQTLEQLNELSGHQFSNTIIDQLVQFMGIYPVSSLVELNTGEIAVVIQQNQVRRLLPRVMILLAPDKTRNEYPATINLLHSPLTPSGEPYAIINGVSPEAYGLNPTDFYV